MTSPTAAPTAASAPTSLPERFAASRHLTELLAAPLSPEDQTAQSMPDASPTKWHRAHTTWFYEEFVLGEGAYEPYDATFRYLFNSYYEAVGPRHPRPERGLVTRPGAAEVGRYRAHVDEAVCALLAAGPAPELLERVELGVNHEQQHQELVVMDAKHLLSRHAFGPAMIERPEEPDPDPVPLGWRGVAGGVHEIGHDGVGFAYDNEGPRHRVFLEDLEIATRAVTVQDWLAFMADGGYRRPDLWLSDGWQAVQREGWRSPEYWWDLDGTWRTFTTAGVRPLRRAEPVVHVCFFEADAYARWAGARLPTEPEWEVAAARRAGPARPAPRPGAAAPGPRRRGHGRRRVGVDVLGLPALPRLPTGRGRHRRVQRQVHERPARAARRLLRHPLGARAAHLPQLLPGLRPLGVLRPAARPVSWSVEVRHAPVPGRLAEDVREGLTRTPVEIPPKWFYDEKGSQLFDDITELPEYYPTRTEHVLLAAHASRLPHVGTLVELGAGYSRKTRLLLEAVRPDLFVPLDVAEEPLRDAAARITADFPKTDVRGVVADFEDDLRPLPGEPGDRLVALLGSTIGNFPPAPRAALLGRVRGAMDPGDLFLLGADLLKDRARLVRAYDDAAGVTAAFNKNVLAVLARELDADLDPDDFDHVARFDEEHERIEMRLRTRRALTVRIGALDRDWCLAAGEEVLTETSAKFRVEGLHAELRSAGLEVVDTWVGVEPGRDASGPPDFAVVLARRS